MSERGRLDAYTCIRAAQRDRFELRHDLGHRAVRECRIGEVDEGRHSLGFDQTGCRIDTQNLVEMLEIDSLAFARGAIPKEVRSFLCQPEADARRGGQLGQQPGLLLFVTGQASPR